jgi:hypothetical protein
MNGSMYFCLKQSGSHDKSVKFFCFTGGSGGRIFPSTGYRQENSLKVGPLSVKAAGRSGKPIRTILDSVEK